jgi:heme oxygenase
MLPVNITELECWMADGGGVPVSRRARLKAVTSEIHQAIDHGVSQGDFLVTRSGYNAYLVATLQARRSVEAQLDASGVATLYPCWESRRTTPVLEQDLADLNGAGITPGGGPKDASPLLRRGGVWGAVYVLEGSALGARVLRRLVARLGMTPDFGARHLAHQTSDAGAWKRFVGLLEDAPLSVAEDEDCMCAALATFGRFQRSYGLQP